MRVTIDDDGLMQGLERFLKSALNKKDQALRDIGSEVLRLSQREVPHDTGLLQNSASVEDGTDEVIVGYNKVYAARLHENPQYRFKNGRKGKYLEDPIKNNVKQFRKYYEQIVNV